MHDKLCPNILLPVCVQLNLTQHDHNYNIIIFSSIQPAQNDFRSQNIQIKVDFLAVLYLGAALRVRVALQDVSHHGGVPFLYCPVEGSLSILMWKEKSK